MTKKSPFFSLVMPVYNRGDCVQNAILSVLDQDFKDYEFIIVDDGSTDGTERIVKSFVNPRIKYFKIPHTGHIGEVRNYGIQQAQGEWIVVQDSDDRSHPDRLTHLKKFIDEGDWDVVYHDMYVSTYIAEYNGVGRFLRHVGEYDKKKLIHEQYIPAQMAYKREIALKTPYDNRITVSDDFQILVEFALNNYKFGYLERPLYEYFMRTDSANMMGELDGRRFEDTRIIIAILKEKYGVEAVGELKKWSTMTGKLEKQQYVK